MCSDGTDATIIAAYNLVKNLDENYLLILCLAHKLELAIKSTL